MHRLHPFARGLLLYGVFFSLLQFLAQAVFGFLLGLPSVQNWLQFPIGWLHRRYVAEIIHHLSPNAASAWDSFEEMSYVVSIISNSFLWGFAIALFFLIKRNLRESHAKPSPA